MNERTATVRFTYANKDSSVVLHLYATVEAETVEEAIKEARREMRGTMLIPFWRNGTRWYTDTTFISWSDGSEDESDEEGF
jgi:hypothetical protein